MFRFSSLLSLYGRKYKSWVLANIEQPIEIVVEEDLSKKMIKLANGDSRTETTLGPAERDKEAVVNDLARSGTTGLG